MSFSSLNAYQKLSGLNLNTSVLTPSYDTSSQLLTLDCQGLSFGVFVYNFNTEGTTNINNFKVINIPNYAQFQLFLIGYNTGTQPTLTISNPVPYNVYFNNGDLVGNSTSIDLTRGFYINKGNNQILITDAGGYVNSN